MAGAEAAVHKVNIDKPQIPQRLLKGSKFLKWPKSDGDVSFFKLFPISDINMGLSVQCNIVPAKLYFALKNLTLFYRILLLYQ